MSHARRRTLISDLGSRLREARPCRGERAWHEVKPDVVRRKKLRAGLAPQAVGLLGEKEHAQIAVPAAGVQHPFSSLKRAGEARDLLQEMPIGRDDRKVSCEVQVGLPELLYSRSSFRVAGPGPFPFQTGVGRPRPRGGLPPAFSE